MSLSRNSTPKVSVVIPCFNGEAYLSQTLDSVVKQSFCNYEIIVIDDGSTDSTSDIVIEFQKRFSSKIKYYLQENQGVAVARNSGIRNARGEYIAFIDADDEWTADKLQAAVEVLDANSDVILVHTKVQYISEKGELLETVAHKTENQSGRLFKKLYLRKANIATSSVIFRRGVVERGAIFDENLTRLGCEDRDFWLQVSKIGIIAYINKVQVKYKVRGGSLSRNREKMLQGREYVANKHKTGFFWPWLALRHAKAVIKKEEGDEYLFNSEYRHALSRYISSLVLYPFSLFSAVNMIKCLVRGTFSK